MCTIIFGVVTYFAYVGVVYVSVSAFWRVDMKMFDRKLGKYPTMHGTVCRVVSSVERGRVFPFTEAGACVRNGIKKKIINILMSQHAQICVRLGAICRMRIYGIE